MSDSNLHPIMQAALAPHIPRKQHPTKLVEGLYALADLLADAERVLDGPRGRGGIWRDLSPERADDVEKILGAYDFLMTSKAVRAYADAWQAELDTQ